MKDGQTKAAILGHRDDFKVTVTLGGDLQFAGGTSAERSYWEAVRHLMIQQGYGPQHGSFGHWLAANLAKEFGVRHLEFFPIPQTEMSVIH